MAGRRLTAEERAAWAKVARSVRSGHPLSSLEPAPPTPSSATKHSASARTSLTQVKPPPAAPEATKRPAEVLDGSWERQIRGGRIVPEQSIDLHGHTLSAAHQRLNHFLAFAIAQEVRVVLVITGRPRNPTENSGGRTRGAIRAEIGHWLAHGPHAGSIASVRTAHPRHGGAGALYIILRRKR
ncbi:MAG TPA: Smr/MutS family protein [Sphingobium sp.]